MWAQYKPLVWKVTTKYSYSLFNGMGTFVRANTTAGGLRFLVNKTATDFDGKMGHPEFMATFAKDSWQHASSNWISEPLSQMQKSSAYKA